MHALAVFLGPILLSCVGQAAVLKIADPSQKPLVFHTSTDPSAQTVSPEHELKRAEGDDDGPEPRVCNLVRKGFGPLPDEDTPEAFRDFKILQDISKKAPVPKEYEMVAQGLDGSLDNRLGFLGFEFLEEYDPVRCASFCDELPRCGSFNICKNIHRPT